MTPVTPVTPVTRALLALCLAACGGGGSDTVDAPRTDGPRDTAGDFTTCEGACRTTALTATFGADTRTLDRAYYGVTKTATETTLHVEAYKGGGTGCPTMTSPTTDYTLVLGKVVIPTTTTPSTSPGNILDFQGDLLDGPLGAAATLVTLTPVAADVCTTCVGMPAPSDANGLVALDVALTFAAGTISGHLFATHCDELDATM